MTPRRLRLIALCLLAPGGCAGLMALPNRAVDERTQTIAHVADTGLDVETENGSVEVASDPEQKDVKVVAKITATGPTKEDAAARLATVKLVVERRAKDQVLAVSVKFPEPRRSDEGCAFIITVPAVKGVDVRTSNGSVTVSKASGPIKLETVNGDVKADAVQGEADLSTSNGGITFKAVGPPASLRLKTSNGSVTATLAPGAGGTLTAETSNGDVVVKGAKAGSVTGDRTSKTVRLSAEGPRSEIETSNGGVTVHVP
jgi:Putative adhesin